MKHIALAHVAPGCQSRAKGVGGHSKGEGGFKKGGAAGAGCQGAGTRFMDKTLKILRWNLKEVSTFFV